MKNQIRVTESKTGSLRFHTYVGGDFAPAKGVSLKAEEAFELVKSGKAEFVDIYSDKEKTFNYISVSKNGTVKVHSVHRTIDFEYRMSKDPDVAYLFEASDESTGGLWNGPVYDRKYAVRVYPSEGYWDNAKDAYFGCGAEAKAAELGVKSPAHKAYDLLAAEKAAKTVEAEIAAIEEYAVSADAFEAAVEAEIDAAAEFVFDVQAASDGETVIGIELDKLSNHDAELVRKIASELPTLEHLHFCVRLFDRAVGKSYKAFFNAIEPAHNALARELSSCVERIFDYDAHERAYVACCETVKRAHVAVGKIEAPAEVKELRRAFAKGEYVYELADAPNTDDAFTRANSPEGRIKLAWFKAISANVAHVKRSAAPLLNEIALISRAADKEYGEIEARHADAQTFPPRSERTGSDKDANVEPDTESVETAVDLQATADKETVEDHREQGLNAIERTFEHCIEMLEKAREKLKRAFEKSLDDGEDWRRITAYLSNIASNVEDNLEYVERYHPDTDVDK